MFRKIIMLPFGLFLYLVFILFVDFDFLDFIKRGFPLVSTITVWYSLNQQKSGNLCSLVFVHISAASISHIQVELENIQMKGEN